MSLKNVLCIVWCKSVENESDSFQLNPNEFEVKIIRIKNPVSINPSLYWFRLKTLFEFIRIDASDWNGMNRIKSDWFLVDSHWTILDTFFELVWDDSETDSETDSGMFWNTN